MTMHGRRGFAFATDLADWINPELSEFSASVYCALPKHADHSRFVPVLVLPLSADGQPDDAVIERMAVALMKRDGWPDGIVLRAAAIERARAAFAALTETPR